MSRYLQVKEIDTLAGNPNTARVDAPLGQPLIDRETGYFYTKRNALGSTTPSWGRVDQAENVQASYGGETRAISNRFGEIHVNAKDWLEGDGATNDTEAMGLLLSVISSKSKVFFPPGTYLIDSLNLSKDVSLVGIGAGQTIFKHSAGSSGHMISCSVALTGTVEGITFDGNMSNQDVEDNFYALLYTKSDGLTIRDCTFQNFVMAGVLDYQTLGVLTVDNCKFLNGKEISDSLDVPYVNCGLQFTPGVVGGAPYVVVTKSIFWQDAAPTSGYRAPGGILFMGSDTNSSYNAIQISDCFFKRVGDASVGGNGAGIAAMDLYKDSRNLQISNVIVEDTYFVAAKIQESWNVQVNNLVVRNCDYTLAIDYSPGERTQEDECKNASFSNILVENSTGAIALEIHAGDTGGFHNVTVNNFIARDVACGIRLEGLDVLGNNEGYGPVNITNAQIWSNGSTNQAGVEILGFRGVVSLSNSYIETTGANGFRALTAGTNTLARIKITGCDITADTAAFYAVRIGGVAEATITGNTLSGAGAGGAPIQIRADVAGSPNNVGKLIYRDNIIRAGTPSIDLTKVDEFVLKNETRVVGNQRISAGNVLAAETDLWSVSLAANALYNNGDTLEFEIFGQTTANANTKRIRVYLGATVIYDSGAHALTSAATDWVLRGRINRASSASHRHGASMQAANDGWLKVFETVGSENLATALTFKVTGQGTATDDVQITFAKATISGLAI